MKCGTKETVLLVHNYYQIPGGEDAVVANEKRLLEEHGHRVLLYTRHNNELKQLSMFQKLLLPITTIFHFRTYRDIRRIIREAHIDIVHVHNTLNLISPAVYYAARSCKIPVVQTVHNFRLLCPGATFYRDGHICEDCVEHGLWCAVKHGCYRGSRLQTLACVLAAKFHRMTGIYGTLNYICLTEFNREKLLQLRQIRPERVFLKPNFVDAEQAPVLPASQRKNQFIFVGRLDKLKGVDILLKAWKLLGAEAPKLLVCGTGPMEDWCKAYAAENHLEQVALPGFVPNQEVRHLIGQSQALILPTQWYEGFPMTMAEAFSVGTPVLCSDLGNAGRLVHDGVNGYHFRADSAESICAAVRCLEAQPPLYPACRACYEAQYTQEQNYALLQCIYQNAEQT